MFRRTVRRSLLLAAPLLGGCSSREHVVQDAYRWQAPVAAGTRVRVRNLNGSIQVAPSEGSTLRITASKRWRRGREQDVRIVTRQVGRDIVVCALYGDRGRCDPDDYQARGRLSGWTRFVRIFSLRKRGNTDMAVRFVVAVPAGAWVDARTVNGSVNVNGVRGGVEAHSVNGSVRAEDVAGPLKLETVNGSVRAELAALASGGDVELSSINGSVQAVLPASAEGSVELNTVNGKISTDFPLTTAGTSRRHSLSGVLGRGGRRISLRTVNGSVKLLREQTGADVTTVGAAAEAAARAAAAGADAAARAGAHAAAQAHADGRP